jgi:hypothetical protein
MDKRGSHIGSAGRGAEPSGARNFIPLAKRDTQEQPKKKPKPLPGARNFIPLAKRDAQEQPKKKPKPLPGARNFIPPAKRAAQE